ncbi:hypothetical protein ACFL6X_08775 [Candidatus Latescibacterota bacterium]
MEDIAYRSWALIPVDTDPAATAPLTTNPPMMASMALDRGASLAFELASQGGQITISVQTTALSAEGRNSDLLRVFSGSSASALAEIAVDSWEKATEGMNAIFSCRVPGLQQFVKLHSATDSNLIVTGIHFARP